jgi:nucleoid DNA-binding protein
MNQEQVI